MFSALFCSIPKGIESCIFRIASIGAVAWTTRSIPKGIESCIFLSRATRRGGGSIPKGIESTGWTTKPYTASASVASQKELKEDYFYNAGGEPLAVASQKELKVIHEKDKTEDYLRRSIPKGIESFLYKLAPVIVKVGSIPKGIERTNQEKLWEKAAQSSIPKGIESEYSST